MINSNSKSPLSTMAALMCALYWLDHGICCFGQKTNVYQFDFPRDGDANYDGVWGHNNLSFVNGWHSGKAPRTNLKVLGSYSGNIAYYVLSHGSSFERWTVDDEV